jgi:hypothetical protein
MILDKEGHREILLQLVQKAHFPGGMAKAVSELIDAIETATVDTGYSDTLETIGDGGYPK